MACSRFTSSARAADLPPSAPAPVGGWSFDAVVFDMDGVLTATAAVHSAAWKRMFDEYLRERARLRGEPFREFTHEHDYRCHVDGRPRFQGVEAFLLSRGIRLPFGEVNDRAGAETVCGLGNRKNELFNTLIATEGVRLYCSTVALIHELQAAGRRLGLATSSRNANLILAKTDTARLFGIVVDGLVADRLKLKGKPEPDIFVTAAAGLDARCARTVVIEDAVSGVQAGARGGFGLVVGIAREANARDLQANGADVVVGDLAELSVADLEGKVRLKAAGR